MYIRTAATVLLIVSLAGSIASAQDRPILYQPEPDSPIGERIPKTPEELDQFKFLIGDWDAP